MEQTLLELTHYYVRAFDQRDLAEVQYFFDEDATLIDPSINVGGRERIIEYVEEIYANNSYLNFLATNIFSDESQNFSVVEFILEIGSAENYVTLRGTDHIYWNSEKKIEKLEAFLYPVEVE
jgi:hypothetical protein